jgi:hypothetical protein
MESGGRGISEQKALGETPDAAVQAGSSSTDMQNIASKESKVASQMTTLRRSILAWLLGQCDLQRWFLDALLKKSYMSSKGYRKRWLFHCGCLAVIHAAGQSWSWLILRKVASL